MNPNEIAKDVVDEVSKSLSNLHEGSESQPLDEASKEMLDANVTDKERTTRDPMPTSEIGDQSGEENAGNDAESKLASTTNKYKGGSVNETEESELEGQTAPEGADENEPKRDSELAPKTGDTGDETQLQEMEEEGDEEEPEEESGEESIKKMVKEHLASDLMANAIKEHLSVMFQSDDASLNEEFTNKASTIFESAVKDTVRSTVDVILAENTKILSAKVQKLEEEAAQTEEAIVESVDTYLSSIAEEWMNENALQVEQGLRTEISEEFMSGLINLLSEHNIEIPDEKYDVIAEMNQEIETLKEQLNTTLESNAVQAKELKESRKQQILLDQSRDLTLTEAEKLKSLTDGVEADSVEEFEGKVKTLKEAYFTSNGDTEISETAVELTEETEDTVTVSDPAMQNLLEAMGNFGKVEE